MLRLRSPVMYVQQVDPKTYEAVVNLERLVEQNGDSKEDA